MSGAAAETGTTAGRRRLIVFTRYPEPGQTKTRLIPALGPEGAAELHGLMTGRVLLRARQFAANARVSLEVRHDGGTAGDMAAWLGADLAFRSQGDGDVGRRMARALKAALDDGAGAAVLVGTDCPDISPRIIEDAFRALADHDLVLGPAEDGGYYLIGVTRDAPGLFEDMTWSTDRVLRDTLDRADRLGLKTALVDRLTDVDRPGDLPVWERAAARPDRPRLSVVIPALNEADHIGPTLAEVARSPGVEPIVVDGRSRDHTADIARTYGARVLATDPGRGAQMNAGAARAACRQLFFLHADTRPPPGYDRIIDRVLGRAGIAAGAFELGIDGPGPGLRWIEMTANWRARLAKLPYGDQGLFLTADVFHQVGGFPDLPIMEDFVMLKRLRRRGRIAVAPARVRTSARRWRGYGLARNTGRNQLIVATYYLGVDPMRLARWYNYHRESPRGRRETA